MTDPYDINEGEYVSKTFDENSENKEDKTPINDRLILKNFLERNKTWEQLQHPWSGKW